MRIYPEQLLQHIKQQIPNCCLVFGDETLLSLEAIEQIQQIARQQGYLEKISFSLDGKFDSNLIFSEFTSLSLFSDKKIIELTLSNTTKENTTFIREITTLLNPDILLVLKGPKLNNQQMNSVWFKTLEQQGIYVSTNLPNANRFPQWIFQRLKAVNLHADSEVIDYLCLHFEGNLLAAKQEFEKLALLYPKQNLNLQMVEQSITTHNHFSLFQWIDSLLTGEHTRATRILKQLKEEDTEILLLSATLNSEIQKLLKLSYQSKHTPLAKLLNQHKPKLWPAKQKMYSSALQRIKSQKLESMMIECTTLEIAIKIENNDNIWLKLESITSPFFQYQ